MSTASKSLQDTYAPNLACFGCGPANELGLRIKSFVDGDRVVATWHAQKQHEAYPGMLNGGICGALLDCHLNWAAAHHLMVKRGVTVPPCTVTANYHRRRHDRSERQDHGDLQGLVRRGEGRPSRVSSLVITSRIAASRRNPPTADARTA
jgi:acyl-coenzyme A thioesterase PaaI-like protein